MATWPLLALCWIVPFSSMSARRCWASSAVLRPGAAVEQGFLAARRHRHPDQRRRRFCHVRLVMLDQRRAGQTVRACDGLVIARCLAAASMAFSLAMVIVPVSLVGWQTAAAAALVK